MKYLLIIIGIVLLSVPSRASFHYVAQPTADVGLAGRVLTDDNLTEVAPLPIYTITAYTLSPDETDKDYCIGAGNHNLCELQKTTRICASRDLPLHTKIFIKGIGECVVMDRMNSRYHNRIDILMKDRESAIKWGIRKLPVNVLDN